MPANSQEPNTSLEIQEWLSISEAGRNSPGHGCISPNVSKITLQFRRRKKGTLSTDESKQRLYLQPVLNNPEALNGASVLIGGIPSPLYYVGPGQINAQIPFELDPAKQYQVVVNANGAPTAPQDDSAFAGGAGAGRFPRWQPDRSALGRLLAGFRDLSGHARRVPGDVPGGDGSDGPWRGVRRRCAVESASAGDIGSRGPSRGAPAACSCCFG